MIIPTERGDYKTLQGMLVLPSQIFFSHSHGERYVPWVLLGQVSRSYLINRLLADSLSLWIPSFRAFHRPSNYWMRCIHIMKGNLLKVTDCKCESHLKKKKKNYMRCWKGWQDTAPQFTGDNRHIQFKSCKADTKTTLLLPLTIITSTDLFLGA